MAGNVGDLIELNKIVLHEDLFNVEVVEVNIGHAKRVVEVVYEENGSFHLAFVGKTFESILSNPKIQDLPLVVFSISGEFKCGKSAFLNLLLRFLEKKGARNWTQPPKEELGSVFEFSGGDETQTKGIWMLDEPIIVKVNGNKIAVFLVDTQGCFDNKQHKEEAFLLNAFSLLMCSHFIQNCKNVNENNLRFIAQLVKLLNEIMGVDVSKTIDQSILYLVRDYNKPKECGLGYGEKYLEAKLENEPEMTSCFSSQQCCLLPRPGDAVAEQERDTFYFTMEDFRKIFLDNVDQLCNHFLTQENISLKKVENMILTCREYRESIASYMPKFKKGEFEYAKSAEEIKQRAKWREHMLNSLNLYQECFQQQASEETKTDEFLHKRYREKAIVDFDSHHDNNVSDKEIYLDLKEKLVLKIEDLWIERKANNDASSMYKKIVDEFRFEMKKHCDGITRESVLRENAGKFIEESFKKISEDIPVRLRRQYRNKFVVEAENVYRERNVEEEKIKKYLKRGAIGGTTVLVAGLGIGLSFLAPPVLGIAVASSVATELVITGAVAAAALTAAIAVFGLFGVVDLLEWGHKKEFAVLSAARVLAIPILVNGSVENKRKFERYLVTERVPSKIVMVRGIIEDENEKFDVQDNEGAQGIDGAPQLENEEYDSLNFDNTQIAFHNDDTDPLIIIE